MSIRSRLNTSLVIFALVTSATAALAAPVAFKPVQTYTVGTAPNAVGVGDFNHDGKEDLAVVNRGDPSVGDTGSVSILLGNRDGTFQTAKNLPLGQNCSGLAVGDFNLDENDDIALVRSGDATVNDNGDVTIFLGNGDGTFRQANVVTPGKNPSGSIVAIDLNVDHRLDLIVVNRGDNSISVLLGNGDGSFQLPVAYPTGNFPSSVRVVDLAGNKETDLAVSRQFGLDFLLGNGDGTFRPGPGLACCLLGSLSAVGDFNGDHKLDLVTQDCGFSFHGVVCSTNLRLGNGDGTFQSGTKIGQFGTAAADFDGDGKLDGAGPNGTQISVLPGNGDGTFQPPVSFSTGGDGAPSIALVGDINGDNAPDIVAFIRNPQQVNENIIKVLVNIGTDFTLSMSPPSSDSLTAGQSATSTATLTRTTLFDNLVSLTCSVQPAQVNAPTCSFNSNTVRFDANGEASATLTITANSAAASLRDRLPAGRPSTISLCFAVVAFVFSGIGAGQFRQRRILMRAFALIVFCGLILQFACGGGGSAPSQTYTVTIMASSGATQHSSNLTVTVQ